MLKSLLSATLISALLAAPGAVFALTMPQSGNELADMSGIAAQAYVVMDAQSGNILMSKNPNATWTAASLTKVITALVVLDAKPKLSKAVAMTQADQVAGGCRARGVCIRSAPGVKFSVDGLFHAAIVLSANNAANALARSTGLPADSFVERMNQKAKSLGAANSRFVEPTGMDPGNIITAADYARIVLAAFSHPYLRKLSGVKEYSLRSSNNSRYNQTIKNVNKLLKDSDVEILGAKTGYLEESLYNFSALIKYKRGRELVVVVLGEEHLYAAFDETKILAGLAEAAAILSFINNSAVLGTSTLPRIISVY